MPLCVYVACQASYSIGPLANCLDLFVKWILEDDLPHKSDRRQIDTLYPDLIELWEINCLNQSNSDQISERTIRENKNHRLNTINK